MTLDTPPRLFRRGVLFSSLVALVSAFLIPTLALADGLGIDVVVKTDSNSATENNNFLWIASEEGAEASRILEIRSLSDIDQVIFFEFYDEISVDGVTQMASEPSEVARNLVSFSDENFVLGPGQVRQVSVTFAPVEANTSYFGYVRVFAGPVDGSTSDESLEGASNFRAVVGGLAAVRIPVWFGSGSTEGVVTDFVIDSVEGVSKGGQNFLLFRVRNSGTTPITPRGSVSLTDPDFPEFGFGPFDFFAQQIRPGEVVNLEVPVPGVEEQRWRIFIELTQGPITKTKVFEIDLVFRSELLRQVLNLAPALFLMLAGLVGAMAALRRLRNSKLNEAETNVIASAPADQKKRVELKLPKLSIPEIKLPKRKVRVQSNSQKPASITSVQPTKAPSKPRPEPKKEPVKTEFDLELDSWAESLRSSIREVRSDSTDLVEKYKDVPTRKPRKTKPKD